MFVLISAAGQRAHQLRYGPSPDELTTEVPVMPSFNGTFVLKTDYPAVVYWQFTAPGRQSAVFSAPAKRHLFRRFLSMLTYLR